jgi:hypothetical protein
LSPSYNNTVLILGGASGATTGAFDSVQMCKASATGSGCWPDGNWWTDFADTNHVPGQQRCAYVLPNLLVPRFVMNAVILPDASILAIGGWNDASGPLLSMERFANSVWTAMATGGSFRNYHSTAALLPSGAVLLAGGEDRAFDHDYQVFLPPYICASLQRPTITSVNGGNSILSYGQTFTVGFTAPPGTTVEKVVMMRPSSVTHHADYDQRYVQLEAAVGESSDTLDVQPPPYPPGGNPVPHPNNLSCLPGFYMLFVVTDGGVPSVATWVQLQ